MTDSEGHGTEYGGIHASSTRGVSALITGSGAEISVLSDDMRSTKRTMNDQKICIAELTAQL